MWEIINKWDICDVLELINTKINPIFESVLNEEEKVDLIYNDDENDIDKYIKNWDYIFIYKDKWKLIWYIRYKKKDDNVAYINEFYINPDNQKKWIWTKLLKELEEKIAKFWFKYILLETQRKFYWAVNFYFKNWYIELSNNNLSETYFKKFYTKLVDSSIMFYKKL